MILTGILLTILPFGANQRPQNKQPSEIPGTPEPSLNQENRAAVAEESMAQVSFDLVEKYLERHPEVSTWGKGAPGFRENALFQDYHGLKSFRTAMASFLQQRRGGRAKFHANRVVLAANKLLTFIFANPGDALLVLIFWDL